MGLALEEPEEKDILEIDGQALMMTDAIQGFSQVRFLILSMMSEAVALSSKPVRVVVEF